MSGVCNLPPALLLGVGDRGRKTWRSKYDYVIKALAQVLPVKKILDKLEHHKYMVSLPCEQLKILSPNLSVSFQKSVPKASLIDLLF